MSNNRRKYSSRDEKKDDDSKSMSSSNGKSSRNGRRSASSSKGPRSNRAPGGMNDVSWYAANPQLLSDSSSLSFNEAIGSMLYLADSTTADNCFADPIAIPGIMTILTMPTIGISVDRFSPVNIAARNIYAYVRHANAGHANYESSDLMMYLLGLDSLYSMYSWMTRLYGVMSLYSVKNRYLAETLVSALGANFLSLQKNLSDFRYMINSMALRIGSFCAPASMSYFARHVWMYQGLYLDAPNAKAQIYAYTPAHFMKFEPVAVDQGGILKPYEFPNFNMTFEEIQTYANSLVIAMSQDEDMNIISGDILKAFGAENVIKLQQIPTEYVVIPQYVPEVLNQIQNATLIGGVSTTTQKEGGWIRQDVATQSILYNPYFRNTGPGLCSSRLFNSRVDDPTPADNMVASRLTVVGSSEAFYSAPDNLWMARISSCGADVANVCKIWTRTASGAVVSTNMRYITVEDTDAASGRMDMPLLDLLNMEKFSSHPAIRIMTTLTRGSAVANDYKFLTDFMDVDNAITIGSAELRKMHDTALLSMFTCPQLGLYNVK